MRNVTTEVRDDLPEQRWLHGDGDDHDQSSDLADSARCKEPASKLKIGLGMAAALGVAALYWVLRESDALPVLSDEAGLRGWIERLGLWGPMALISLMAAAIVMSPIPSGPIALAAGAIYGPLWGTVFIVAGAELGSVVAFWIARCLGYEAVRNWAENRMPWLARQHSQTWLMGVVFASRLMPFISFDAISYAAGLTPLAFWRFALATLAGVIPISFALAYFGEQLTSVDPRWALFVAVAVGGITLVPIGIKLLLHRLRTKRVDATRTDELPCR